MRSPAPWLVLSLFFLAACDKELVCAGSACGGQCVSLLTDTQNCGACGHVCGSLEVCSAGTCGCRPGIGSCGGACTDLARDPSHCGTCTTVCDPTFFCTTDATGTSCTASCPAGFTACDRSCVELATDPFDCGACGNVCAAGQACRDGACRSDLHVACYATNEVVPVTADLAPAGSPRSTPAGPTVITALANAVYSANGSPAASVSVMPLDPWLPTSTLLLAGVGNTDLEGIGALYNTLLVTDASVGTLVVVDAQGDFLDEIPMPGQQLGPNPHGVATVGYSAYVALSGTGTASGQSIAKVLLSNLAACAAAPGSGGCGSVAAEIPLLGVPGAADAPGVPSPTDVAAVGGRVYVTLANLELDGGYYMKPAGHGRLAIVDPSAGDALSFLDLGPSCGNAGSLAVDGATLWIACGSFSYPDLAPSVLVPVDLSRSPPVAGTPLPVPGIVPGKVAICAGSGYVTDQASGAVVRFDPLSRTVDAPTVVCPTSLWTWASDVACSE